MTAPGSENQRWLVTGAGGFIGGRLLRTLRARNLDAWGWTRADCDLRVSEAVTRALAQLKPTQIVHLAASPGSAIKTDWTMVAEEVAMVGNLAEAMPEGCRLIHAGSMAEFGRSGRFDEGSACRPRTPYGCAKAAATDHAVALRFRLGRSITVARLFGVYGPGEAPARLTPSLIRNLAAGLRVPLSPGDQVRDFVHVDDVCDILQGLALVDEAPPIVNVGTGVGLTVRTVCEAVADALGADRDLLGFGEHPYRSVDEAELVANTDLLARVVGVPVQRWLSFSQIADYVREETVRLGVVHPAVDRSV